jgi:hypothetical protein
MSRLKPRPTKRAKALNSDHGRCALIGQFDTRGARID